MYALAYLRIDFYCFNIYTHGHFLFSERYQTGSGMEGMPMTESAVQVSEVPWSARYLNCGQDATQLCKGIRYNATCWIERDDGFVPEKKQLGNPGGQASWHPGNRAYVSS